MRGLSEGATMVASSSSKRNHGRYNSTARPFIFAFSLGLEIGNMQAFCAMASVLGTLLFVPEAVAGGGVYEDSKLSGTILFSTVGRAEYAFDVFGISLPLTGTSPQETRLTDGVSVNHDAQFLEDFDWGSGLSRVVAGTDGRGDLLSYVSERDGSPRIYFNVFLRKEAAVAAAEQAVQDLRIRQVVDKLQPASRVVTLPLSSLTRPQENADLLGSVVNQEKIALHDRPAIANGKVYYISTREPAEKLLESWTALYSTSLATGETQRLTPRGVADYSPAISPSGNWIIVASKQGKEYRGRETSAMDLDLYILDAADGSNRRLLVSNGGWPTWKDESTVFFHRVADDGWWSIFKLSLPSDVAGPGPVLEAERVTPSGVHAFTPAASLTGNWLAVATRRPQVSHFRHIEIFTLDDKTFTKVTELINTSADHFNPFVSRSSETLGYHRCRGTGDAATHGVPPHPAASIVPRLERIESSLSDLTLLRVDGDFPAISPDGSLIAYIPDLDETSGLYVMNRDGTGRTKLFTGLVFGANWDRKRPGRIYTSYGGIFQKGSVPVQVIAVTFDEAAFKSGGDLQVSHEVLSAGGTGNNAFPSGSPDGREIVFRSGRSGYKNLHIMDADGEAHGIRQLTAGDWTDTMPNWSPDGEWIAFSSDRDFPDTGSFAIYKVRPDGRDLQRVRPDVGGRMNHPVFSPDSKHLLFTSDLAGNSAEPISTAHQFQPYGELFVMAVDGTNLQRLTHNAYEDGTPTWGGLRTKLQDVSEAGSEVTCGFYDVTWLIAPPTPASNKIC